MAEERVSDDLERQMKAAVDRARQSFFAGRVQTYDQRMFHLRQLRRFVIEEAETIMVAAEEDFGQCRAERSLTVITAMLCEIDSALTHLSDWMKPKSARGHLITVFDKLEVQSQPLGVVAVFAPWNFPLTLVIRPLVGVIAAGNTAVIKLSEVSVAMERMICETLPRYLNPDCFPIVTGGIPEGTALLKQRFDHICFTGSTGVGRVVATAAARHLTPCTLELGGKNPLIIDETFDLKTAAQRIIYAKGINAGQACISVDYIMCTRALQGPLAEELGKAIKLMHGEDMKESRSWARINAANFNRLRGMLEKTKGTIAINGSMDEESRYMGMTVVTNVTGDDSLMAQEIFGPILPILPVDNVTDAIAFIREREKPLALYIYSRRQADIDLILNNTSSGQAVINDSILQFMNAHTPFGGVGNSGMGAYVGQAGFDNFSTRRSVMHRCAGLELFNTLFRYPPQSEFGVWLINTTIQIYPAEYRWHIILALLGMLLPLLRYLRQRR